MKVSYPLNIKNQIINFEKCARQLYEDNWLIGITSDRKYTIFRATYFYSLQKIH